MERGLPETTGEVFHTLLDLTHRPTTTPEEARERSEAITQLSEEFVQEAITTVKIIVNERYLPPEQKTIQPADVGGIAGGTKYVHNQMFFKFAVDSHNLYGGVEWAAKSAGHELKGILAIIACHIDNLHVSTSPYHLTMLGSTHGYRILPWVSHCGI